MILLDAINDSPEILWAMLLLMICISNIIWRMR